MIEEETIASAENVEISHIHPIRALNAKRHPHMDLGENVKFNLRNGGSSEDENGSGSGAQGAEGGAQREK